MMELSAVPDPGQEKSGVAGNQQPGALDEIELTRAPMEGELLPRTMMRLIQVNPQHYGGDQLGPVISAIIGDAQHDKEQARKQVIAVQELARKQIAAIQEQLDKARNELTAECLEKATLQAQLQGLVSRTLYEKVVTFCSPIALSISIDLYKSDSKLWLPMTALGVALLAVNFLPAKGKRS